MTHTDGYPVRHTTTDALLLGMGERYDVLVTAGDGAFPLTALAEGKGAAALAVLRTSGGAAPTASVRPKELSGKLVTADRLEAAESVALAHRTPDRTVRLRLTGGMAAYDWGFDGKPYAPDRRHPVRKGERVRLVFSNPTGMWHPLHLHGHTFALTTRPGGARKDTAIVLPKGTLSVDFDADNPGLWMIHCHNVYHAEAGMMTVLGSGLTRPGHGPRVRSTGTVHGCGGRGTEACAVRASDVPRTLPPGHRVRETNTLGPCLNYASH